MELKVWCEGIPRVVCGITEKTTCRDVVIALAQAMGKVGQYTLIEKWRDRERFIPPDESLLLALGKWGEYAREVQLVLRRSEGRLKVNGHQGNRSSDESKWTNKLSGFSLPHQDKPRPSSSSSIRKSLTFSGAHSHHHVVAGSDTSVNHVDNGSINGSASVENMLECDPEACRDSRTSFSRNTIQAHTENGPRWQQINHASSQSALSSLGNKSDRLSGRSVSQHGNVPFSYSPGLALGGSLERTRRRNRDHSHQSSNISVAGTTVTSVHGVVTSVHNSATSVHNSTAPVLSVSTAVSATSSTQNVQSSLPVSDSSTRSNTKHPSPVTSRLPSLQRDIKPLSRESNNNIDFKPNANLTGAGCDLITGEKCHSKDVYSNEEEQKLELLKLVSEQQEKLEKQERNIEKLEADISLIEHFDHEPKENSNITQELERLEKLDSELDNEIQELELVSWEGKLELEMEKEKRLRSEIETIRKKLKSCESELERMNAKIKELTEEISRQKELQNIEEKCQKEQEAKVLAEIAKLQKQIEAKTSEYQNQLKSVEELSNDLTKKEVEIEEKKKKIAELERELKESNMKLFVRSPGDLIRRSLEGQSLLSRVSRSRPSSARRLDNPDHRNDPVATPKNPHGLWV